MQCTNCLKANESLLIPRTINKGTHMRFQIPRVEQSELEDALVTRMKKAFPDAKGTVRQIIKHVVSLHTPRKLDEVLTFHNAETFSELQFLMIKFAHGELYGNPWYHGSIIEPDYPDTIKALRKIQEINCRGFITNTGQGGLRDKGENPKTGNRWELRQRSYLSGFIERQRVYTFIVKLMTNTRYVVVEDGNKFIHVHGWKNMSKNDHLYAEEHKRIRLTAYRSNGERKWNYPTRQPLDSSYAGASYLLSEDANHCNCVLYDTMNRDAVSITVIELSWERNHLHDDVLRALRCE